MTAPHVHLLVNHAPVVTGILGAIVFLLVMPGHGRNGEIRGGPEMRIFVLTLVVLLQACTDDGPPASAARLITEVCAPTATRSDTSFTIRVGGCYSDATESAFTCEVGREVGRLEVKLLGPSQACEGQGCTCTALTRACVVPALDEGSWRMEFVRGEPFNRDVEVAPQHETFSCSSAADGGVGDAG